MENIFCFNSKYKTFVGAQQYYQVKNNKLYYKSKIQDTWQINNKISPREVFEYLEKYLDQKKYYIVLFISYDFNQCLFEESIEFGTQETLSDIPDLYCAIYSHCEILDNLESNTKNIKLESFNSLVSDSDYKNSINQALAEISAGNTYEINLSRVFTSKIAINNSREYFSCLYNNHQAPYGAFLNINNKYNIYSMSPECFISKQNNILKTFPIKGTSKVSDNTQENINNINNLKSNKKELAEHLMVVDLMRNDLGEVCLPGSVQVNNFAEIESYKYVHHMISEIQGELSLQTNILQVLKSMFPGGSITGAPKINTMRLINKLEKYSRGGYTGTLGYITPEGDGEFNILIRTLIQDINIQKLILNVGGGIVADSQPELENQETYIKAQGFIS